MVLKAHCAHTLHLIDILHELCHPTPIHAEIYTVYVLQMSADIRAVQLPTVHSYLPQPVLQGTLLYKD